jgi:hypothetical protein
MDNTQKELIRQFYKHLVTPEEKELYYKILNMSKEDRIAYLTGTAFRAYSMNADTYNAIMSCAEITKEELIFEAAAGVRRGLIGVINRFISWIKGCF